MLMILAALMQFIVINCSHFDILVNSDASASALQDSLISNEKVLSEFFCLSACSLSMKCFTAIYSRTDLNCSLFEDRLDSSDIVASTSSNLYFKKSSKFI